MAPQFDRIRPPLPGGWDVAMPTMVPVCQHFPRAAVADVEGAVSAAVQGLPALDIAGKSIAITVGSRGIPHIVEAVRGLVRALRDRGAAPFVIPAMGSHGGGNAEGQTRVLTHFGVTEDAIGAPVRASMEVVASGTLDDGTPLFCDRIAAQADGIVLFNKVKPHSAFKAEIESGLAKMAVIGLGKHAGAKAFHEAGYPGFPERLVRAARHQLGHLPVLFGLGVVENAHGELAAVAAFVPDRLIEGEKGLLAEAKRIMGRLLMPRIDVLIVDVIGKDVAGAGMDPNVIGRSAVGLGEFPAPPITKIVVRGLTAATEGNASGIGAADFTTARCVEGIDFAATYANVLSASIVTGARLPVVLANDRDAVAAALRTCFVTDPAQARVVRIASTKALHHVSVSTACLADIAGNPELEVEGAPAAMGFDAQGNLV